MLDLSTHWGRLEVAAERLSASHALRLGALGGVLFGGFVLAEAVVLHPHSRFLLGAGLIVGSLGLWNVLFPLPAGVMTESLAMSLVGILKLSEGTWRPDLAERFVPGNIVLGVCVLVVAVWRAHTARSAKLRPADTDAIRTVETLVHDLERRGSREDPAVVRIRSTLDVTRVYLLELLPAGIVALLDASERVRLASREEVAVEPADPADPGARRIVTVRLRGRAIEGEIAADHLERLQSWLRGAAPPSFAV